MCGFAGMILKSKNWKTESLVSKYLDDMANSILHRGPDGSGKFISEKEKIGFCFQRLSILDLSSLAMQPMISRCKRWIMVFNGEIYNFRDLKKNISAKNDYWLTNSDTEVVLETIAKYGFSSSIPMFNGMFAIAAYHIPSKTLWLARDKFGEKPLYYSYKPNEGFFFSSEIRAFFTIPFFEKKISSKSVANFLRYGYVPDPLSILENTFKLGPGTILRFEDKEGVKTNKFWDSSLEFKKCYQEEFKGTYEDAMDETKERIDFSCKNRLLSDVPLGSFLSGGIDSSNLVYSFHRQNINIKTFSVGFNDKKTNELNFANEIAKKLNTDHNKIIIEEQECLSEINNVSLAYDEPFSDPSQIPTFLLCKHTRKKVTVAISGDGADELFGGYPRYKKTSQYWDYVKKYPSFIKNIFNYFSFIASPHEMRILRSLGKKIRKLSHSNLDELYNDEMSRWRPDEQIYSFLDLESKDYKNIKNVEGLFSSFRSLMLRDINFYLPSNLLVKADRASMFNSLEIRSPFLDEELVKFIWSLPDKYIKFNRNKAILKDILAEKISLKTISRPKQGFEPPLEKWMRGPLKDWLEDLLNYDDGFLDMKMTNKIYSRFLKGEKKLTYKLWTMIMLKSWKLNNFS